MKTDREYTPTFCPANRIEWRDWLQLHHDAEQSVWMIFNKKASGLPGISYQEAVLEALCFGWIDSKKVAIDEQKYMQFFSRRKARSVWSKVNKAHIRSLKKAGLMTKAGSAAIKIAKQNGSWETLDEIEKLSIPPDLAKELQCHSDASNYFSSLSKSNKRALLQWLVLAKRQETRQKRMAEIVMFAKQSLLPQQFRRIKATQ